MQWRGSGFVVLSWWYVVAVVGAVGTLMMAFGDIRWGGRIFAAALVFGAIVRLVARPARKAGGLHARSRAVDVTILLGLAVGILVASATVKLDADVPNPAGAPGPLGASVAAAASPAAYGQFTHWRMQ